MCFSSGSSQVKAKPANPLSRFAYNQPVTNEAEARKPPTNATEQPGFGSELGASTPAGGY